MQAARGASLTPEGAPADETTTAGTAASDDQVGTTRPRRARALTVFAGAALLLYAVDQATKAWAVAALSGRPDRPLVGEVLQLTLVRNPGAAFSTGTAYTEVFTGIAAVAVVVVLWLSRRLGSVVWAVGLGVLLAGVAGNLTDRLLREPGPLRGHVIDFLMLPSWPVFNIADMCINVAAALILVQAFRGVHLDGTRVSDDEQDEPEPESQEPARSPDHAAGKTGEEPGA
jgi:signal peptidase II